MDVEVFQLVGLGIVAAILALVLKQHKPELSLFIAIAAGVIILLMMTGRLVAVVAVLDDMARRANLDQAHLSVVLKAIGIAYITEFGAQVCKDAGENSIASKIELGGKIIILSLTLPILVGLIEVILQVLT
ncbi:stage III sporulation protein AD [Caldicoprobacter algeriensis]|uniref:stage III sporulation protein AD n=1 Tax=Caldicoprobacter algeriensis TaxID=699281 RepID=UPI0020796B9E|nr:stage III sporulation protein AD [Caldicoprobacter algeriensis]MCM8900899.1 stage III sporulation protein AD [Caldicoprobacter algeriensis]